MGRGVRGEVKDIIPHDKGWCQSRKFVISLTPTSPRLDRIPRLTEFGAIVLGKQVTSHVQNGPSTCLDTTDLSTPEYLYWSKPLNWALVIRMAGGSDERAASGELRADRKEEGEDGNGGGAGRRAKKRYRRGRGGEAMGNGNWDRRGKCRGWVWWFGLFQPATAACVVSVSDDDRPGTETPRDQNRRRDERRAPVK
jgi:hypothetical protein